MMNQANPEPQKTLILFAHPALEKSRVNEILVRAVEDLPGVTINDLYEEYPDLQINVAREQRLLEEHQIIVFHHPFYWYSTPAILKEWQDLVLEHGWAYGSRGKALHGKMLLSAITTGGGEAAYRREGRNRFTIMELLAPIEQTAVLCGMDYLPPFVVHGTHQLTPADVEHHAQEYRRVLQGLSNATVDLDAARALPRLNSDLSSLFRD